jgi:tetratricopeptide (TPR) repeat protein
VKRALRAACLACAVALPAGAARAEDESDAVLFSRANEALSRGAYDDAIDRFELLADRGFSHPDASYDRAIAYVRRAESNGARPGDLGRAAAALSETLELRPDDADADVALDRVRQEIVRRRARQGAKDIEPRPSLGWAIVGLAEEDTWALLALFATVAASLGLAVRFVTKASAPRLAGLVAASVGGVVLVITAAMAFLARFERLHYEPAVVIVDEARLSDENGAPITGQGSIVPEGGAVRVDERRGTRAHVEWGTLDGWLPLGQVRLLARR